ncbi:hypothetical protein [Novosphingobium sp. Chol11]|uniref:hypothetical protein n=1 Tax=Novosphingobium sp. Chol11 TaxID=1385763 RepID=UPI0025DB45D4|nr:hypothetical protein [Novosphingobium sp. Chol11]
MPNLSQSEWRDVQSALQAAADCGCAETSGETIGLRFVAALTGRRRLPVPEHLRPLREFLCASERLRRPAMQYAPALAAQGYSPAQIEAIGLISA